MAMAGHGGSDEARIPRSVWPSECLGRRLCLLAGAGLMATGIAWVGGRALFVASVDPSSHRAGLSIILPITALLGTIPVATVAAGVGLVAWLRGATPDHLATAAWTAASLGAMACILSLTAAAALATSDFGDAPREAVEKLGLSAPLVIGAMFLAGLSWQATALGQSLEDAARPRQESETRQAFS